jgi:hypothetical protein
MVDAFRLKLKLARERSNREKVPDPILVPISIHPFDTVKTKIQLDIFDIDQSINKYSDLCADQQKKATNHICQACTIVEGELTVAQEKLKFATEDSEFEEINKILASTKQLVSSALKLSPN